ncbi:peptidoglycan-binding protein [Limnothrix sp. FACHB-881]|uniref:peptidoglycan-binding domain-containing protein n=1 Tax=Limnothrix sp. FACHB-881 TaxID=2692819 RepID=UPI001684684D|nr:peptidoglycan-binding protein [Limnothrix sp. FACHB-881]MBD2636647.1 peptidoglycan-binding protein [Limnothrix sp. FACHB-881]
MGRAIERSCVATAIGVVVLGGAPAWALSASQRSGDVGPSVVRLQRQLKTLGNYGGPLNGQFDNATAAALEAFQRSRGLYTKGAVDIVTKRSLLEATGADLTLVANLQPGDRGPSTRELQRLLNRLGFLAAEPTGNFDSPTRQALERFQQSLNLSTTGHVDLATMQALRDRAGTDSGQGTPTQPNRPISSQPATASNGLGPGQRSAAVRQLQTRLRQLGFFTTTPTGFYGPITSRAVRAFQQAAGLTATGRATPETLRAIETRLAAQPANARSTNARSTNGQPADRQAVSQRSTQPTPAQPATPVNPPDRPSMRPLNPDYQALKPGDSGDRVKALQDQLRALGFLKARSTGFYGDITQAAVTAFQQSRQLPATGQASPATLRALFGASSGSQASPGPNSATPARAVPAFQSPRPAAAPRAIPNTSPLAQRSPSARSDDRWLMPGDRGVRVTALQQRLAALGLLGFDRVNGVYDNLTAQAVINFQRSRRLSPTGIADLTTQRAMGLL